MFSDLVGSTALLARMDPFISLLAPLSAGASLLNAAPPLEGIASLHLPRRVGPPDPSKVAWVAEGDPMPVAFFALEGVPLGPTRKMLAGGKCPSHVRYRFRGHELHAIADEAIE